MTSFYGLTRNEGCMNVDGEGSASSFVRYVHSFSDNPLKALKCSAVVAYPVHVVISELLKGLPTDA